MGVGIMRDSTLKRRHLIVSHTLGCAGRNNSNPSIGSDGHAGSTRPDQTRKTPKDLSTREREERGRGESVGFHTVHMRWGGTGRVVSGVLSLLAYTLSYVSLADLGRL